MRLPQKSHRQFFRCMRVRLFAVCALALGVPLAGAPRASGARARVHRERCRRRTRRAALSILLLGPPAGARRTRTRATPLLYLV